MLAIEFITWWYGAGYRRLLKGTARRIRRLSLIFSLPLLVATLGAPWRRIITDRGSSLSDRARAALDNLVSRAVGLVIRGLVILVALLLILLTGLLGVVALICWPFAPLAAIGLILRGLLPW